MVTFKYEEIKVIVFNLLNKKPDITNEEIIRAFYKMFAFEIPEEWITKAKREWVLVKIRNVL